MYWVVRQNKLELPNDEEEVNTGDIHKCDGQAHDPDTMTAPLTPKPTFQKFVVYYESIKREPKIRGIYECRCDERLQTKTKEFTRLPQSCVQFFQLL
jgi:hypothetical protein